MKENIEILCYFDCSTPDFVFAMPCFGYRVAPRSGISCHRLMPIAVWSCRGHAMEKARKKGFL